MEKAEFTVDYFSGEVESALSRISYPATAPGLYAPISYTLDGGGKRLRPVLLLAVFAAVSGRAVEEAMPQALAVEMFHNFTLLHDDVMDDADIRRGRPAVHRRWNASVAILSGDAMLTLSSQLLAQCPRHILPEALGLFNTTAMEVYQGQQLDLEFQDMHSVSEADYLEMIRLKTSVLLACACALGAMAADSDNAVRKAFYEYGLNLGLAFQMRDDWLDTYGDPAVFGKQIGGDILNRKKTWLYTKACEDVDAAKALDAAYAGYKADGDEEKLIAAVREIYDSLELGERLVSQAANYAADARRNIACIEMDERAREFFNSLADKAATRDH